MFDEQRYLRGYLLILNIRLTKMLGFSGLDVSPAPIFVDARNADPVTIAISSKTRGGRLLCRINRSIEIVSLEIKAVPGFRRNARIVLRRLEDCGVEFV